MGSFASTHLGSSSDSSVLKSSFVWEVALRRYNSRSRCEIIIFLVGREPSTSCMPFSSRCGLPSSSLLCYFLLLSLFYYIVVGCPREASKREPCFYKNLKRYLFGNEKKQFILGLCVKLATYFRSPFLQRQHKNKFKFATKSG